MLGGVGLWRWLVKSISIVLLALMFKWLISHQFTIPSISACRFDMLDSCRHSRMTVSSAYFIMWMFGCVVDISAMYRENSSGDRTQPCGLPVDVVQVMESLPPHLTVCFLFDRKLWVHMTMLDLMPFLSMELMSVLGYIPCSVESTIKVNKDSFDVVFSIAI